MRPVKIASILAAVGMLAGVAQAQTLSIVTTQAGSFTNSVGSAVAKVIVEHAGLRATVSPQQSHGQEWVNDGSAELSLATISDLQMYVTGTVDYAGKGEKKNIRLISRMIPIRTVFYVRTDSPVKSIADLKGKRVSVGYGAQKSVYRVALGQLATAGLSEKDVEGVPARNIIAAANDFAAGKTDAFVFALGSGKVKQVAASVGGIRALEVPSDAKAVAQMRKFVPGSYPEMVKPSKTLDGVIVPTTTLAYDVVLFTRANMSDDVIYKITKAVHDNKKDMAAVFRAMNGFQPDRMSKKFDYLSYHPGAEKFFKEKNLWPPKE
ncbi:MAG: hypothetical protein A3H32_00235 [Betaproteobacteria bacterium RIFCSPLOWO2_02_FULL_63_19]|nr:MAG: hypothetical protein A3H32_00235 [Betaproteobacteria bacterium RIFCSPLOWO2_02_FULL_63_19]OGA73205.1 MAG: hypothetical protein A3G81_30115 [Betaproteobacteria bacterium RIFCSPLOWO2_12_FULL_65_14]